MNKINYKKASIEELILYTQNSNIKATEELIKRIQKDIYTFFCHLCTPKNNISDLTQETLIKIIKNINNLKNPKNFKSWQKKIAINTFYDFLRKQDKYNKHIVHDEEIFPNIEDNKQKPQECCEGKEINCKIRMCIINLPINSRLAIILRELNGFSYEEIAKLTNSNLGTVKSRISRAREKLQIDLANYI